MSSYTGKTGDSLKQAHGITVKTTDAAKKAAVAWKVRMVEKQEQGKDNGATPKHTYTESVDIGDVLYACGRTDNNWSIVSKTKDGADPFLVHADAYELVAIIRSGRQWVLSPWKPDLTKTWTRFPNKNKEPYPGMPTAPSSSGSGGVPGGKPKPVLNIRTVAIGKGKAKPSIIQDGAPLVIVGSIDADNVVVTDGNTCEWATVDMFDKSVGKAPSGALFDLKTVLPSLAVNDPLPTVEALKKLAGIEDAEEDGDLGFFGGLGAWLWCGIEGVGLMAYGANRLYQETVTMPLLNMFREPERWQYKVRVRTIDVGASAPVAPEIDGDDTVVAGRVDGGGFGAATAATGAAMSGVAYSTLAFLTWPFRKWAGDEFVQEVDPLTGAAVEQGKRGEWLLPVKDPKTGKDVKRVGRDATGAVIDLAMMQPVPASKTK